MRSVRVRVFQLGNLVEPFDIDETDFRTVARGSNGCIIAVNLYERLNAMDIHVRQNNIHRRRTRAPALLRCADGCSRKYINAITRAGRTKADPEAAAPAPLEQRRQTTPDRPWL